MPAKGSLARDRFVGAMLGAFVGDALGMPYEGAMPMTFDGRMHHGRMDAGSYTDDTEMTIGLAEALMETEGDLRGDVIAAKFLRNFHPGRGYGMRIYGIMDKLRRGAQWDTVATDSWGNGAAMRVAPVGVFFYDDLAACAEAARLQASVTHLHSLGLAGAVAQALGVAAALRAGIALARIDPDEFVSQVEPFVSKYEPRMADALGTAAAIAPTGSPVLSDDHERQEFLEECAGAVLKRFPCDVSALGAVPGAFAAFLMTGSFRDAVTVAICCGGDADTVGALTGALAGAYYGAGELPAQWTEPLENGPKGRDYVVGLAKGLARLKGLPEDDA